jgi:cell division protein ZapA
MTESEKAIFSVEVAGLPLKLKSSHDEATVNELIKLVDTKVKEALSSGNNLPYQKALLLACLHIAEDFLLLKRTGFSGLSQLEIQAQGILSDLESSPISRMRLES